MKQCAGGQWNWVGVGPPLGNFFLLTFNLQSCTFWRMYCTMQLTPESCLTAYACVLPFSFSNTCALCARYLGSVSVPAQVLREAVKADVVGLTLRPRWAERQAVIVLLHLLHLRFITQTALKMKLHLISRWTYTIPSHEIKGETAYSKATTTHQSCGGDKFSQAAACWI